MIVVLLVNGLLTGWALSHAQDHSGADRVRWGLAAALGAIGMWAALFSLGTRVVTWVLLAVFSACFGSAIACWWRASDAADDGHYLAFDAWTRRGWVAVAAGIVSGLAMLASLGGVLDDAARAVAAVGLYGLGFVLVVAGIVCIAAVVLRAKGGAS